MTVKPKRVVINTYSDKEYEKAIKMRELFKSRHSRKRARDIFWEPYLELMSDFRVCSGSKSYPSIHSCSVDWCGRIKWLEEVIEPLLESLANNENKFKNYRWLHNSRCDHQSQLESDIKEVWKQRSKIHGLDPAKYKPQFAMLEEAMTEEEVDKYFDDPDNRKKHGIRFTKKEAAARKED